MSYIAKSIAQIKPCAIWAYIDTIECFVPRERYRQALERGDRFERIGRVIPCTTRKGFVIGARLVVNEPSALALTLPRIERAAKRYGGIILPGRCRRRHPDGNGRRRRTVERLDRAPRGIALAAQGTNG